MALTATAKKLLNNINIGTKKAKLGDALDAGFAPATAAQAGVVKQAATQANSVATDAAGVVTDLNALLTKLRAAGILAP